MSCIEPLKQEVDKRVAATDMEFAESIESKWQVAPFSDRRVLVMLPTRPSLWYRIWMRVFFGWKFERLT